MYIYFASQFSYEPYRPTNKNGRLGNQINIIAIASKAQEIGNNGLPSFNLFIKHFYNTNQCTFSQALCGGTQDFLLNFLAMQCHIATQLVTSAIKCNYTLGKKYLCIQYNMSSQLTQHLILIAQQNSKFHVLIINKTT